MSKSIRVKAIITATSNKQSEQFESKNPRKSIYLNADPENSEILKSFGLTEYTSKTDPNAKPFFIVKAGEKLDHYVEGVKVGEIPASIGNPNFTSAGEEVYIMLFQDTKGTGKLAKTYTRAFAVNGTIEEVVAANPFEDLAKF